MCCQCIKIIIIIRFRTYSKLTKKEEKKQNEIEKRNNLQVQNNSFFTSENGGGIGEQGIENAEITRVDLDTVHDSVLVYIQNGAVSSGVQ